MANSSRLQLTDGIIEWFNGPEWDDVVEAIFQDASDLVRAEAQANAPWEDRSGDARAGLTTDVYKDGDEVILELFHTVEHGYWLEVIQNGKFAIILPTLEEQGPRIMREASKKVAMARRGRN